MMMDLSARSADLGLVIEARDSAHAEEIRKALEVAGFRLREPQVSPITRTSRFYAAGDSGARQ
jgi:hypothetical protein